MLHLEAEWPSKENILIEDTILAESGLQPGFKVWGRKIHFRGKDYCFYHMFETNYSEHNNVWRAQIIWGETSPECPSVSAGLGKTVARKSSIGGLHVCAGRLDTLKIYI